MRFSLCFIQLLVIATDGQHFPFITQELLIGYPRNSTSINATNVNVTTLTRSSFVNVPNLMTLTLSGNITNIDRGTFDGLNQLKELRLTKSGISYVKAGAIYKLNSLEKLHLDGNNIKEITIHDMNSLETLNLNENKLESLNKNNFKNLPVIKRIYLKSNNISSISTGTFNDCQNLGVLDLSNNKITHIENGVFLQLKNLTVLYLTNNNLTQISRNDFITLRNLSFLYLNFNQITGVDISAFSKLTALQYLYLSNNRISYLHKDHLQHNEKLYYLQLNHNLIKEIPQGFFRNTAELNLIDFRFNLLNEFSLYDNVKKLRIIYLEHNEIKLVNLGAEIQMTLQYLYLSDNNLMYLNPKSFQNLTVLKILNLSSNRLKEFSICCSKDLNLLNLSHNTINLFELPYFCNTTASLGAKGSLNEINLSYNNLEWIHINSIKAKHPKLKVLNLGYNPLNDSFAMEVKNITEFGVIITDDAVATTSADAMEVNQREVNASGILNRNEMEDKEGNMNIIWIAVGSVSILVFLAIVIGVCTIRGCRKSERHAHTHTRDSTIYDDVMFVPSRADDEPCYEIILPPLPKRSDSYASRQRAEPNNYKLTM